jgi:uncharacterized membrane protein YeaQ/YmgE (transglycosylase-associated protein family)
MGLITFLVVGLIVGAIARLLVPGPDRMGLLGTLAVGVVGSWLGSFLANLLFHRPSVGWIGSIAGAVLLLLVIRAIERRGGGGWGGRRGGGRRWGRVRSRSWI